MIKVDEVGLGILSPSLWAVSGVVTYLSTVEAGIVRVSCSLGHSSLVVSLVPSSLAASSSPVAWRAAPGQIHGHQSVVHRWWGIGGIILWSSTSSLPSWHSPPIVLGKGMSLTVVVNLLICCPSSLHSNVSLMQQSIDDSLSLCEGSYLIFQGIIGEWSW